MTKKTESENFRGRLVLALKEVKRLRDKVSQLQYDSNEPIAIVGIGLNLPGGAKDLDSLWSLLRDGTDAIRPVPAERWDVEHYFDPDPGAPGKINTREAGFLDDADRFDAGFFKISPREAMNMDPQHRILQEVAWQAFENAGIVPSTLASSDTGVFVAIGVSDYRMLLQETHDNDVHVVVGTHPSFAAGRISYFLGLQGPAVGVDTACASSLVGLHLACNSLRVRECSLAVAGGTSVIAAPRGYTPLARIRALSPSGRSRTFSDNADGYGRGEGAVALILERLSDAERNGREILGVIRGSAITHDGPSSGLTTPNGAAQSLAVRNALKDAGLTPSDIDYVECHGTGTKLGDPIEVHALGDVHATRPKERPLMLGTIKSNIGHLEAAAGLAGVAKVIAAMRHRQLPASLNCLPPNKNIDWAGVPVSVVDHLQPWSPAAQAPRRAGVSAFGLSGTNAHVIIEEAASSEAAAAPPLSQDDAQALPYLLSGCTPSALQEQAQRLLEYLDDNPGARPVDVVHTLANARTHFEHRAGLVAADSVKLHGGLEALASDAQHPSVVRAKTSGPAKLVFVFPGQGAQWVGMAESLMQSSDAFCSSMEACHEAFAPYTDWSLLDVLREPDGASLERVDIVQPVLFAMMVSLVAVWREFGVVPDAVVGHSQGEIAAAHVCGALTLEDAAKIVTLRSRVIADHLGRGGGMAAISLSAADLEQRLELYEGRLALAVDNGPNSTVVSGDSEAIDEFVATLQAEGTFARRVRVTYSSHSPRIDAIRAPFHEAITGLEPRVAQVPMFSTVDSGALTGAELDANYWFRNLRQTVHFARATNALLDSGHRHFIEISAHPILSVALKVLLSARQLEGSVIGTLRREEGSYERVLLALTELHAHGHEIDWARFVAPHDPRRLTLPTYAFQRERYWVDAPPGGAADVASAGLTAVGHPVLRAVTPLATEVAKVVTASFSTSEQAWVNDHLVYDSVIVPGVGLAELALAGLELFAPPNTEVLVLDELVLGVPMMPEGETLHVQIIYGELTETGARPFSVHSRPADAPNAAWTEHATGLGHGERSAAAFTPPPWPPQDAKLVDAATIYDALASLGFNYGPAFRGLQRAWSTSSGEAYAEVELPGEAGEADFMIHPALFDAALHTSFVSTLAAGDEPRLALPFAVSDLSLHATDAKHLRVRVSSTTRANLTSLTLEAWEPSGKLVVRIGALESRPISREQLGRARPVRNLYTVAWRAIHGSSDVEVPSSWGLIGDQSKVAGLALQLQRRGVDVSTWESWATFIEALEGGQEGPQMLLRVWPQTTGGDDIIAQAHDTAEQALLELNDWLTRPQLSRSRLALVTRLAVGAGDHAIDLVHAPLLGLSRAARSENVERDLWSLDIEDELTIDDLVPLLALDEDREFACRNGTWRVPRLEPAPAHEHADASVSLAEGSMLITGGTGELGAHLARHLVRNYGARNLILTSRRGKNAPGASELVAELLELGAEQVEVTSCDVADRQSLERLLASIPETRALRGVFHTAGLLDDGLLVNLEPAQLHRVLEPKLDGVINLDTLTRGCDLDVFLLYSGTAGIIGNAGQGNYAAANTFLDAFAHHRRNTGKPGLSLVWGLWTEGGMIAELSDADFARIHRRGIQSMSIAEGMALFDAALLRPEAQLVPIKLDVPTMRRLERVPPLMRSLAPAGIRRAGVDQADGESLVLRLAALPMAEREAALLDIVSRTICSVLSLPGTLNPDQPLNDLGLDSLMAVELRNLLQQLTKLTLPSTLVFDYPTARKISGMLLAEFELDDVAPASLTTTLPMAPSEDIAIVGMACRYPGDVEDPDSMWRLLAEGRDAISEFPTDRGWPPDLFDPDPDTVGKSISKQGGFLYDAADFDPSIFGMSRREAPAVDPQQRLLLEVSWEALEHAGIAPASLSGSQTGVFVGVMYDDYGGRFVNNLENYDGYVANGSAPSSASGRISYTLGLEGPALTVNTACSSSLVALHLACQSLRAHESDLSLVGGVAIMATPFLFVDFSRLRGMAPNGRCKSFSDRADGTGWSEGVGVLVLERLEDARRHGHRVLALVRGSAVNQDGRSQGLTAPNGPAQQRVIRAALAAAKLEPQEIDVVEAHGTGTRLGDPIEAQALVATYGRARSPERPLWLGSVKSNIGHTQAAAGIAGIIKMILAMQHQTLPKTLHVGAPTPEVDWSAGTVELLTEARPWETHDRPRRAGVSSFGASGTNAHVILEDASALAPSPAHVPTGAQPLLLSGGSEATLRAQAERLQRWLQANDDVPLAQVGYTLATGRSHFDHRASVVATSREAAMQELSLLARAGHASRATTGQGGGRGKLAFLFTGQGSQRLGMGKLLHQRYERFRHSFDQTCALLDQDRERPLAALVFESDEPELLSQTLHTQPALFALEVALFRLVESFGLTPHYVMGHSIGELAAAHVAGVMSLEHACTLVAARARLMQSLPASGGMLSVQATEAEVLATMGETAGVVLAGLNGPSSTVVSGDQAALESIAERFERDGRKTKVLAVSHAFHSHHMEPILAEFGEVAASLEFRAPKLPLVSNISGKLAGPEICEPEYWVRHVREPVHFLGGVRTLEQEGVRVFLELGPHGVLSSMAASCLADEGRGASFASVLRRDQPGDETLVAALGLLHCQGLECDWPALFGSYRPLPAALPTYAFQHERFWLDAPAETHTSRTNEFDDELWGAVGAQDTERLSSLLSVDQAGSEDLAASLQVVARARHGRDEHERLERLRYRVEWTRISAREEALEGRWLVVSSATMSMLEVLPKLTSALSLRTGVEPLVCVAKATSREELSDWLRSSAPLELAGVLSLLALNDAPHSLHPVLSRGQADTLSLVQALGDVGVGAPLWALTAHATVATTASNQLNPAQAAVWGLGRSVGLEHPDRWGGLIDLPGLDDLDMGALLDAVAGSGAEKQLALGPAGTFAPRLVRAPMSNTATNESAPDCVLVTGGLGGVGSAIACSLAEQGTKHLVLTSRRGAASPSAARVRAELERLGATVTIEAIDASDREALAALFARFDQQSSPITGIVHAAGVAGELQATSELSLDAYARVCAGKVAGAINLHDITRDRPLTMFAMTGSVAGVWGSTQQAAYSSANAFLDALATQRERAGLPATSIAWGPWAGVGMLDEAGERRLTQRGLRTLEPPDALNLFLLARSSADAALVIADVDWQRFAPLMNAGAPYSMLSGVQEACQATRVVPSAQALRRAMQNLGPRELERAGLLDAILELVGDDLDVEESVAAQPTPRTLKEFRSLITRAAADVLRTEPAQVPANRSLTDLGLDSLMALELRNQLGDLDIVVPVAELLRGVDVESLTAQAASANSTPLSPRAPQSSWLSIPHPRPRAKVRLLCFPYAAGGPPMFSAWPNLLGDEIEVVVVHLPGRGSRLDEAPLTSMDEAVEPVTAAAAECLQDKPFATFGHCLGAIVMAEVVTRLEHQHGLVAERVIASGAAPPSHYQAGLMHLREEELIFTSLSNIGFSNAGALSSDPEFRKLMMPMLRGDFELVATYSETVRELQPWSSKTTVIVGLQDWFVAPRFVPLWRNYTTADAELHLITGEESHHYFIESKQTELLAFICSLLSGPGKPTSDLIRYIKSDDWDSNIRSVPARPLPSSDNATVDVLEPASGPEPRGHIVVIPDVFEQPLPLSPDISVPPGWEISVLRYPKLADDISPESVIDALIAALEGLSGPLLLVGHGFGGVCAAEFCAKHPDPVFHLVLVNCIPPGHYGLPFLDLATDDELTQLVAMFEHPNPRELSMSRLKQMLQLASAYSVAKPSFTQDCATTLIRCRRSMFFSFNTALRWQDACTASLQIIDLDDDHYANINTQVETILRDVCKLEDPPHE